LNNSREEIFSYRIFGIVYNTKLMKFLSGIVSGRLAILLIIIFLAGSAYGQVSFGFNGGLTYDGITGDVPEDAAYKRKVSYTAGVNIEYNFSGDLIAGIGLRYYRSGTVISYDIGEKESKDSFDVSIDYLSIPLTFKVLTEGKHTYFTSGLDLRALLNSKLKYLESSIPDKEIKNNIRNYEAEIFAGFGGIISFGKPNIALELRYSHSLTNISKDSPAFTYGMPARFRFSGFQLLISFNYSK
jgi:hypothetical protein